VIVTAVELSLRAERIVAAELDGRGARPSTKRWRFAVAAK